MPLESKPVPRGKDEEAMDQNLYCQAVGCILYAALGSRPDFAYAIGVLGRFAGDPSVHHWKAIKHLLRYIKGTLHLSLPLVHKDILLDCLHTQMLTMVVMRWQASLPVDISIRKKKNCVLSVWTH